MPHAIAPTTGLQAIILCGPGESLQPFNSKPDEFPKALVPIANRPMVWYPLNWCHRTGITNITIITPASCQAALEAALSQNPHLTSLPNPKGTVLAPEGLKLTTGTAEIFRSPQVQAVITGDFIVLPCDLVCEQSGISFLENWLPLSTGLLNGSENPGTQGPKAGLSIWYEVKDSIPEGGSGIKKEETDFLVTAQLVRPVVPAYPGSLRDRIEQIVLAMPTATLKDKIEEDQGFKLRYAGVREHGQLKMTTKSRDAHLYVFPHWTKAFMGCNEAFESISEDVLGYWAKARWQKGLDDKLRIGESIGKVSRTAGTVDPRNYKNDEDTQRDHRVPLSVPLAKLSSMDVPPLLAYMHPTQPRASLLRRVDNAALLLSVSLFLAKQPSTSSDAGLDDKPFAHDHKIHPSSVPAPELRLTLDQSTVLMDANVVVASKSTVRESVIGVGCVLGTPPSMPLEGQTSAEVLKNAPPGVRLQRCLLMEGVTIGSGSVLNGCVLGRRVRVGDGCDLRDCKVQEGYVVADGTVAKGEVLAGFAEGEGMEDGDAGGLLDDDDSEDAEP